LSVTAVVGLHWGDEGKGKVIDALAQDAKLVVRFNGGANAGHTIVNEFGTFRLHLVPGGIFNPGCRNLIGPGCVVNPDTLLKEIADLNEAGHRRGELFISNRAHVTLDHHLLVDRLEEASQGHRAHGTTKQGIWPTYTDKVGRIGVTFGDLVEPVDLEKRLSAMVRRVNGMMAGLYAQAPLRVGPILDRCLEWADALRSYVVDGFTVVQEALDAGSPVLVEGHLGAMRDLDWGIYPYVTSSTTLAGGACAGAGIPPRSVSRVVGVVKAYTTAVGAGAMPTEEHGPVADRLREIGQEYGATTGRPRRCGWFDGVAARFASRLNGCTDIAVMKLDVLDAFDPIRVCVGYEDGGKRLDTVPSGPVLERVTPIYEELPAWKRPVAGVTRFEDLPAEARAFLLRLQSLCGAPITWVGTGPRRGDMIHTPGGIL
jgi:adenylosuccinate synthase